jgi:4'-phosphopantetheinyl transferase
MAEALRAGEAHVWYLWPDRITDPEHLRTHGRILSDEEHAQNSAFRFLRDRHAHLLTRAFVRTMLSTYADVKSSEWQFSRNPYGKPEISGPAGAPPITFNISHTAGCIACVFALDTEVGIDTENLRHSLNFLQIARDHFSPSEFRALQGLPKLERHRRFFEYWTLKESYIKARGMGLSLDLTRFSFHLDHGNIAIIFDAGETEDPALWRFQLLKPGANHLVAVAVRSPMNQDVKFEVRDGTGLMQ